MTEELRMAKENIVIWTEKMERLHHEKFVLKQTVFCMQKEYETENHKDMVALRRMAADKVLAFKACNAQLIAMHEELKRLMGGQNVSPI